MRRHTEERNTTTDDDDVVVVGVVVVGVVDADEHAHARDAREDGDTRRGECDRTGEARVGDHHGRDHRDDEEEDEVWVDIEVVVVVLVVVATAARPGDGKGARRVRGGGVGTGGVGTGALDGARVDAARDGIHRTRRAVECDADVGGWGVGTDGEFGWDVCARVGARAHDSARGGGVYARRGAVEVYVFHVRARGGDARERAGG